MSLQNIAPRVRVQSISALPRRAVFSILELISTYSACESEPVELSVYSPITSKRAEVGQMAQINRVVIYSFEDFWWVSTYVLLAILKLYGEAVIRVLPLAYLIYCVVTHGKFLICVVSLKHHLDLIRVPSRASVREDKFLRLSSALRPGT